MPLVDAIRRVGDPVVSVICVKTLRNPPRVWNVNVRDRNQMYPTIESFTIRIRSVQNTRDPIDAWGNFVKIVLFKASKGPMPLVPAVIDPCVILWQGLLVDHG